MVLSDWDLDGAGAARRGAALDRGRLARIAPDERPCAPRRPAVSGWLVALAARARALERRAIPDALWQLTLARYPVPGARAGRGPAARCATGDAVPRRKEFTGAQRPRRSPTRWRSRSPRRPACRCCSWACAGTTASSASSCTPTRWWRRARSTDEDGVVHALGRGAGRRSDGGRPGDAVLARRRRRRRRRRPTGYNVVIHEFVHVHRHARRRAGAAPTRRARRASGCMRWTPNTSASPTRRHRRRSFLDPTAPRRRGVLRGRGRGLLRRAGRARGEQPRSTSCCDVFRQDPAGCRA